MPNTQTGNGRVNDLIARTGLRLGGWPQLASAGLFLVIALVVSLHFLPAWTLAAPAVALALTSFGINRGLAITAVGTVLLAPLFQPLLAPVAVLLAGALAGAYGWRTRSFVIGAIMAVGGVIGFIAYYLLAMKVLIPVAHIASLNSWDLMPTFIIGLATAYAGYRYIRSAHTGENWYALGLAAVLGASWFAVPLAAFLTAGKALAGVGQFVPALAALAFAVLCTGFVFIVTWRSARNDGRNSFAALGKTAGLAVLWCAIPFTVFATTNERFVQLQMRYSMNPEYVTKLPNTVNDRTLPRSTGELYIQNANRGNLFSTEKPHIQYKDGHMFWQSPIHNHRWQGNILGSVPQVIRVDADRVEDHKENTDSSAFRYGNDSWVVKAAFMARHPFSEVAESAYYHTDEGPWVLLISHVSERPTITGTMIPYLAGVMAVDQNGWITDYTVGQAEKMFPGAAFFPSELQRRYADAYGNWRAGFWGTWVNQEGIMEVSEKEVTAETDPVFNPQPYIINVEGWGLQGVVAFEPKGDTQYALLEVLFFDASSGQLRAWVVPANVSLNGPNRAMDQVRSSDSQTDWSHRATVEPRLAVGPRGIYWLGAIVKNEPHDPQNQSYITSVLVDAESLRSYKVKDSDAIRDFMAKQPEEKK